MSRAAAHAHIHPGLFGSRFARAAEFERPAVAAEPRPQTPVQTPQHPIQERQEAFVPKREQRNAPRGPCDEVVRVQKRKRAVERFRAAVLDPRHAFHQSDHFLRSAERVHVPSTAPQPPVDPVRQGGRVRHRDIQRAARFQNAPGLAHRRFQFVKVLQAVVAANQVEAMRREGHVRRVAPDVPSRSHRMRLLNIQPDHRHIAPVRREAPRARAHVQHAGAGQEALDQVHHQRLLSHKLGRYIPRDISSRTGTGRLNLFWPVIRPMSKAVSDPDAVRFPVAIGSAD